MADPIKTGMKHNVRSVLAGDLRDRVQPLPNADFLRLNLPRRSYLEAAVIVAITMRCTNVEEKKTNLVTLQEKLSCMKN